MSTNFSFDEKNILITLDETNIKFNNLETNVQVDLENQFKIKDKTDETLVKILMLKGEKGDTGSGGDKNYVHTQLTSSDTWVITHNLNKYPSVTTFDSTGEEVIGDITYNNVNQVTISFAGAFKGRATLN